MLSPEDMAEWMAAEEERLRVNAPDFIRRHDEIMAMADDMRSRYRKNAPASTANTDRGRQPDNTAIEGMRPVYHDCCPPVKRGMEH